MEETVSQLFGYITTAHLINLLQQVRVWGKTSRFVFQAMSAILQYSKFLYPHHCTLIYPYANPVSFVDVENFVRNILSP